MKNPIRRRDLGERLVQAGWRCCGPDADGEMVWERVFRDRSRPGSPLGRRMRESDIGVVYLEPIKRAEK